MMPIFDLHCDLLHYLAEDSSHSADDGVVGCSLPQLRRGGIALQTFAIYTPTEVGSRTLFLKQISLLQRL